MPEFYLSNDFFLLKERENVILKASTRGEDVFYDEHITLFAAQRKGKRFPRLSAKVEQSDLRLSLHVKFVNISFFNIDQTKKHIYNYAIMMCKVNC